MATDLHKILPAGYSWRELWLPQNIVGTSCPSSVSGGHALTLTGARRGSTTDGLEMRGAELITITDHADISITDDLTVVLPAFILRTTFDSGASADMGLLNLNNGSVIAWLESATGALNVTLKDAGAGPVDVTISTTKVSWAAGTLWEVGFTYNKDASPSFIFYINGAAENTDSNGTLVLTVPVGDTTIGYDGTTYLTGKLQRSFKVYDTTVLTAAQMLGIYKGYPYPTNLKAYLPMDCPGRGLTLTDRSTGGNCDGTISGTNTAMIWDFGATKLVLASCDGLNDTLSGTGLDIGGDVSVVLVMRMGCTYVSNGLPNYLQLCFGRADAADFDYFIMQYISGTGLQYSVVGNSIVKNINFGTTPSIGDYWIIIGTYTVAGAVELLLNGDSLGTESGLGVMSRGAATFNLGSNYVPGNRTLSGFIAAALVEGALSAAEARRLSRFIDQWMGLGIGV